MKRLKAYKAHLSISDMNHTEYQLLRAWTSLHPLPWVQEGGALQMLSRKWVGASQWIWITRKVWEASLLRPKQDLKAERMGWGPPRDHESLESLSWPSPLSSLSPITEDLSPTQMNSIHWCFWARAGMGRKGRGQPALSVVPFLFEGCFEHCLRALTETWRFNRGKQNL